ncbi:fibronectin type III domain-containing protein [Melioribacteraceae bacterium 4301-Me]|uniref:fibronectin type III domain-containing protein n=1 Tax=Pyranulibacter aquaticus TaxID=3163344 RepID=UPI0035965E57
MIKLNVKIIYSILFIALFMWYCVENITDSQTSTPSIELYSPLSGDTVHIGKNTIKYAATDAPGGSGLDHFEIFINNVSSKIVPVNSDGSNPNLFLEVDSSLIFKKITYYVVVYNKAGKYKKSATQENIYVIENVPKAPGNLTLTRIDDYTVNLLWDDSANNETNYEVWRKEGTNGNYHRIQLLPANTISTNDGGLSPFVDYFYKVRAFNNAGFSNFSNEVSTNTLPGGPWNLTAEAIGASKVILHWNDFAVNEMGFIIERTNPRTGNFERLSPNALPNSTEYTDYSVMASTGYKYRVAYYTSTTVSGYSNEVSISTFYTDVPQPTNLTAVFKTSPDSVILKWTDNTFLEKGTVVERKTGSGGAFKEIGTTASDVSKFADTSVSRGVTYYYRVRQILGDRIYTEYSNTVQLTTPN